MESIVEKFRLSTIGDPMSTISRRVWGKVDCWSKGPRKSRLLVDVFRGKSIVGRRVPGKVDYWSRASKLSQLLPGNLR